MANYCKYEEYNFMVKVAVIDDCLIKDYLSKEIIICSYTEVQIVNDINSEDCRIEWNEKAIPNNVEYDSHGVKVINTIKKYAKEADVGFYYYNIFDKDNHSSGVLIIETIKRIIEIGVDFIVMSLSCPEDYREDFLKFKDKIIKEKIIFIAAADTTAEYTMPANLDFVYGVGMNNLLELGAYSYQKDACINFCCNAYPEFVGDIHNVNLFWGTSKGTAVIAGRLIFLMYNTNKITLLNYLSEDRNESGSFAYEYSIRYERNLLSQILSESFEYDFASSSYIDKDIAWNSRTIKKFVDFLSRINKLEQIYELDYEKFRSIKKIMEYYGV